ncbi:MULTISPECIES: SDR family oxidoreductase [unclassified Streptomyces]|uniref:SDR family oxidoreductase n=1 Tax=unclassified Streptomyces TaxID=2593676 RepID=UPI0036E13CCA
MTDTRSHTALVLGGSSGLGRASAAALLAAGSRVLVTSRDAGRAAEVARELGAGASGIALDLADPAAIAAALPELAGLEIDQLVLNSGGPAPSTASELTTEALRTAMEQLLFAHITLTKALLPGMLENGWGRIVAIGSSGVQSPIPTLAVSNIGRAALAAYLKSLAGDVADRGVTVNMVLPGRIATARVAALDEAAARKSGRSPDEVAAQSAARIPANRYGDPAEFGAAVSFLASEQAAYITGEQLRVDGGMVGSY